MDTPIVQIPAKNFTVGRGGKTPIAVVLHEFSGTLEQLDYVSCKTRTGKHASFHYGISDCLVHSYVGLADTAWSFDDVGPYPTLPVSPQPTDPNPVTINIAIPSGTQIKPTCTPTGYANLVKCLAELLCAISRQTGLAITLSSLVTDVGELADFPIGDVVAAVSQCMVANCNGVSFVSSSCFVQHPKADALTVPGGMALWDNVCNCIVEATTAGQVQHCDYTAQITFKDGEGKATGITINGVPYLTGTPIPLVFPNAPALQTWLNTLGQGQYIVNYVSGSVGGNVTISILVKDRIQPVNSISYIPSSLLSTLVIPFASSNCVNVPEPVPAKPLLYVVLSPTDTTPRWDLATGTLYLPDPCAGPAVDTTQPYTLVACQNGQQVKATETVWAGISANGGIIITPGGPSGHTPTFTLMLDPSSTAPVSVGPAGLKIDCCVETPWAGVSDNGAIVVTAGGTDGHSPHFALTLDPASTAPVSIGPAGLRVDCCAETNWAGVAGPGITVTNGGVNGHAPTIAAKLSADPCNLLALGADGGLFANKGALRTPVFGSTPYGPGYANNGATAAGDQITVTQTLTLTNPDCFDRLAVFSVFTFIGANIDDFAGWSQIDSITQWDFGGAMSPIIILHTSAHRPPASAIPTTLNSSPNSNVADRKFDFAVIPAGGSKTVQVTATVTMTDRDTLAHAAFMEIGIRLDAFLV